MAVTGRLRDSDENLTCSILSECEGANATEDESKDPDTVSSAMLSRGILARIFPSRLRIHGLCPSIPVF